MCPRICYAEVKPPAPRCCPQFWCDHHSDPGATSNLCFWTQEHHGTLRRPPASPWKGQASQTRVTEHPLAGPDTVPCETGYLSGTMAFLTRNRKLNRTTPPLTTRTVQRESRSGRPCQLPSAPLRSPAGRAHSVRQLWPQPPARRLPYQKYSRPSEDREETPPPKAPGESQLDSTGSDSHSWTSDHAMWVDGSLKERPGHEVRPASLEANGQCGKTGSLEWKQEKKKNLRIKHYCVKIIL